MIQIEKQLTEHTATITDSKKNDSSMLRTASSKAFLLILLLLTRDLETHIGIGNGR